MKRILLSLLVLSAAVITKAQQTLVVDANASVRQINGSFSSIKISDGIDLYLSQSNEEAVAVSASDEKFKDGIKTVIEGSTLRIFYTGEKMVSLRNRKLKAYVSFKSLDKIHASGACDVVVAGTIDVPSLEMHLSGACDFKGMVKVNSLKLDLSGASDVSISGTAGTVDIESSGASDVKGFDLVTDVCNANASGASDINITVNKELNAQASGASDIYFKGDGLIKDVHTSGASNVSRKKS